ncbi:cellulose synthase [Thermoactinospora rubra]|uniref:cellulose synthase n=1 Tax=Thermoactinospora rubra TaxID=1088767 RepID=UPI000A0F5278|nr:cellulose synthase [Thermoactinospora rubra]
MLNQIPWLLVCGGLTAAGLVLTILTFRRRGAAPAMRLAAWSLLPMAAYLTGAIGALWTIGATAVGFVTNLVLNPLVWAGVALAGVSLVLFVASGVLRSKKIAQAGGRPAKPKAAQAAPDRPAVPQKTQKTTEDDFSDIEEILRRRGIG